MIMARKEKQSIDKDNLSRTIILSGEVNHENVADMIQTICDINDEDDSSEESVVGYERKPIRIIINSPGGTIYDGFGLIGVIETSKTPVHTICYGHAMSMALLILVSGHKRFGHSLATYMYHECLDTPVQEKLSTLKENLEETARIMAQYDDYLISKTAIKRKQLDTIKRTKLDWYISSEEALRYKFIDEII